MAASASVTRLADTRSRVAYFNHDADVGIIGRGATVEAAFVAAERAGLARRVAFVRPLICVKG